MDRTWHNAGTAARRLGEPGKPARAASRFKRTIDKVILGGMSANLCVESHMRELLEQGFDVAVVKDATAAAITPELGDGYASALVSFMRFSVQAATL